MAFNADDAKCNASTTTVLLQIQGEGGTGKSKVIQTITGLFNSKGVQSWLIKSAYTSIAASLIGGDTTHRIGGLTMNGKGMGAAGKAILEDRWKEGRYLIIDEVSMIAKKTLANISCNIAAAKRASSVRALSKFCSKHKCS